MKYTDICLIYKNVGQSLTNFEPYMLGTSDSCCKQHHHGQQALMLGLMDAGD